MLTVTVAFIVDCFVGDPESRYHPVALLGQAIKRLDTLFYSEGESKQYYFFTGTVVAGLTMFFAYGSVRLAAVILETLFPETAADVLKGIILSFLICPRSLAGAADTIRRSLIRRHLDDARKKLSFIVGRDTENLSESEICRAAVETVAENTSDGIVAPLFFYVLGGVPLAAAYKAVNTLDSMMGYKNAKYIYYGRFAARLDDVCNFIPARITAVLVTAAAFLCGFDYKNAWRIMRRDARKHPSPNGGYAEAPVAGALHIRLGGYNSYFGEMTFREYMGDEELRIMPKTVSYAVRLMYTASLLAIVLAACCRFWE